MITLRADRVTEDPDLPTRLYRAFVQAKQAAAPTRPELVKELTGAAAVPADEDAIPYGLEANAASIQALIRYAHEQHLLDAAPDITSIFAAGDYPTA